MSIEFYVIRKKDNTLSERLSDDAVNTGRNFGIKVHKFDALYGQDGLDFLSENNLKAFKEANGKESGYTRAIQRKCVFASHCKLWFECIEKNETIGILEHDAIFLRKLPDDIISRFDDVLYLDTYSRPFISGKVYNGFFWKHPEKYKSLSENKETIKIEKFDGYETRLKEVTIGNIGRNYIRGVHGYLVRPSGAKKLIEAARNYGYLTADVHINPYFTSIHVCKPSIARINDFFCNGKNFREHSHCEASRND
jgi:GR25 family glycosyltransferase involved in LPS biosynthesis